MSEQRTATQVVVFWFWGFSPDTKESYFGYDRFTRQRRSICTSSEDPFLLHAANTGNERKVLAVLELGNLWSFKTELLNTA